LTNQKIEPFCSDPNSEDIKPSTSHILIKKLQKGVKNKPTGNLLFDYEATTVFFLAT
jgi:hypothetical protein